MDAIEVLLEHQTAVRGQVFLAGTGFMDAIEVLLEHPTAVRGQVFLAETSLLYLIFPQKVFL